MEHERPNYYAIIPADVRYDDKIPPNAKLLYGEISALIGAEGFCYASNSYFMRIYGFSDPTITRLLKSLEDAGYIKRVIERDNSGQVSRRRIYLSASMPCIHPPINFDTTSHQNQGDPPLKIDGYTNTSNTNIPPLIPPAGDQAVVGKRKTRGKDYKERPDTLPDRFEGFWLFYRTHMPPDRSAGNRQAAIRAWDKLAPTDEQATILAKSLGQQVRSQAWQKGVGVPHASTWLNNHGWEDSWGDNQPQNGQGSEKEGEWL